ncbi:hypothetical protein THAOC_21834, partial [Thalassiosira oceanica]
MHDGQERDGNIAPHRHHRPEEVEDGREEVELDDVPVVELVLDRYHRPQQPIRRDWPRGRAEEGKGMSFQTRHAGHADTCRNIKLTSAPRASCTSPRPLRRGGPARPAPRARSQQPLPNPGRTSSCARATRR